MYFLEIVLKNQKSPAHQRFHRTKKTAGINWGSLIFQETVSFNGKWDERPFLPARILMKIYTFRQLFNIQQSWKSGSNSGKCLCSSFIFLESCCWGWRCVRAGVLGDEPRHWWRKQQGPHTPRPISMVQHIKLSFTDKRHSAPLLVTPETQQVVAEWGMATLCVNRCALYFEAF